MWCTGLVQRRLGCSEAAQGLLWSCQTLLYKKIMVDVRQRSNFFDVFKDGRSHCCEVAGRCVDHIHLYVCAMCTPISPLRKAPLLSVCTNASCGWCRGCGRYLPLPWGPVEMSLGKRWGSCFLFAAGDGWRGKRRMQMHFFCYHHIPPCIVSLYLSFGALTALTEK